MGRLQSESGITGISCTCSSYREFVNIMSKPIIIIIYSLDFALFNINMIKSALKYEK